MKIQMYISALVVLPGLFGCAANQEVMGLSVDRLGQSVAIIRAEQTYNPNATAENMGYIPTGTGERMEAAYDLYIGKETKQEAGKSSKTGTKKASNSQVLSNSGW